MYSCAVIYQYAEVIETDLFTCFTTCFTDFTERVILSGMLLAPKFKFIGTYIIYQLVILYTLGEDIEIKFIFIVIKDKLFDNAKVHLSAKVALRSDKA